MNKRLSSGLLLGVVLTVSVLVAIALAAGGNGVALAGDDVGTNKDPDVLPITVSVNPVPVNTPLTVSAVYTDPEVLDTHTAVWDWGDGNISPGTVEEENGSGSVTGSHVYDAPEVYTVKLTVTDNAGNSGESSFEYLVVYDPEGGFVTGGGWIDSLEGAYAPDPLLTGKATFGFVSKYKKGADAPIGQTQFQFHVADLNFHSSDYEWLLINQNDSNAQYKGSGTINGASDYKFMLWAKDLDPDGDDTFRIKIWSEDVDGSENTVYDNGFDQAIGGGSIVIHKGKGQQ